MAEFIPTNEYEASHQIDAMSFHEDVYTLMTIFLSSKHFLDIDVEDNKNAEPPYSGTRYWAHLAEEVETRKIPRLLVSIATTLRVKTDDGGWWSDNSNSVGTLSKGALNHQPEVLSMREACNKIIHATKVHYDVEPINDFEHIGNKFRYLNPMIYLYGENRGKKWKACLDIHSFCKGCLETIF